MAQRGISRTSAGLRESLWDAMDALQRGDMMSDDARAYAMLAKEICRTVNLEIEVQKLRVQYPADANILVPRPLQLGETLDVEPNKVPQVRK